MRASSSFSGCSGSVAVLVVAALLVLPACSSARLSGQAMQVNPMAAPSEDMLRESARVRIKVRDMEVPRAVPMYNTAYFAVVSRDRLRFHVELVHKWEEMVEVSGWRARLEDDQGHVFRPGEQEHRTRKGTGRTWDEEQRTAVRTQFGDPVRLREDGWKQRIPLVSVDLFKGRGDLVFTAPNLMHRGVKRLTLVLERGGVEMRFTWNLFDPMDDADLAPGEEPNEDADLPEAGGVARPRVATRP